MAYETTDQLLAEISDHWRKDQDSNMYKLFDIYNAPMEKISDNASQVESWHEIGNAQGTTLDLFGKDFGVYRQTENDPSYRFQIRLKALLARAQGTIPSIVKIIGTAIGDSKGIKIWQTKPRHLAIQVPNDYASDQYTQQFLLNNLQNMVSLGMTVDQITFVTTTKGSVYLGAGTIDHEGNETNSDAIWWTGWQARTFNHWFFGTKIHYLEESIDNVNSN